MRRHCTIAILLALSTAAVYVQVGWHQFINYDDGQYILENSHVVSGLNGQNLWWAFTHFYASNWHPLTWISHMLDIQIFGKWAGGHHLVSLALHIANSLLLYAILLSLTGATSPSALVAFLFALHPLHVESVAWASERKDVLSTLFWMLTICCYIRFLRRRNKTVWYVLTVGMFLLGLLAKPMLVSLPWVLLLLDWWPLGRFQPSAKTPSPEPLAGNAISTPVLAYESRISDGASGFAFYLSRLARLVFEKLPLFLLAIGSCVMTYLAQKRGVWADLGLDLRVANAATAYAKYILLMLAPLDLAPIYPYLNRAIPVVKLLPWFAIDILITVLVVRLRRRFAYLLFGWLWYLGTLLPVIGLVQVGVQTMADRYTYIPLIGPFIMLAWGLWDLLKWLQSAQAIYAAAGAAMVICCALVTAVQVSYWRDSIKLFGHTIAVTDENFVAHRALAKAFMTRQQWGNAMEHARLALKINPEDDESYATLGGALARTGKFEEAIVNLQRAVSRNPTHAYSWKYLGVAHEALGRSAEAMKYYRQALRRDPDHLDALRQLAWILGTVRDPDIRRPQEAIDLATRACQLSKYHDPWAQDILGAAYAAAGRFPEAIATAEKARSAALALGDKELATQSADRMRLYKLQIPYYQPIIRIGSRPSARP